MIPEHEDNIEVTKLEKNGSLTNDIELTNVDVAEQQGQGNLVLLKSISKQNIQSQKEIHKQSLESELYKEIQLFKNEKVSELRNSKQDVQSECNVNLDSYHDTENTRKGPDSKKTWRNNREILNRISMSSKDLFRINETSKEMTGNGGEDVFEKMEGRNNENKKPKNMPEKFESDKNNLQTKSFNKNYSLEKQNDNMLEKNTNVFKQDNKIKESDIEINGVKNKECFEEGKIMNEHIINMNKGQDTQENKHRDGEILQDVKSYSVTRNQISELQRNSSSIPENSQFANSTSARECLSQTFSNSVMFSDEECRGKFIKMALQYRNTYVRVHQQVIFS